MSLLPSDFEKAAGNIPSMAAHTTGTFFDSGFHHNPDQQCKLASSVTK